MFLFAIIGVQESQAKFDYDHIKKLARNNEYYTELTLRFNQLEADMSVFEYAVLYYGAAFRKGYEPFKYDLALRLAFRDNDNDKVLMMVKELERLNPASLHAIDYYIRVTSQTYPLPKDLDLYRKKRAGLLSAIVSSGDGTSKETAFKLAYHEDIGCIVSLCGVKTKHWHQTQKSDTFYAIVEPNNSWPYEKIWFNNSLPIEAVSKKEINMLFIKKIE